jgi:integrase
MESRIYLSKSCDYESRLSKSSLRKYNRDLVFKYLKYKEEKKFTKNITLIKYVTHFSTIEKWFDKRFNEITRIDFEDVLLKLKKDEIINIRGDVYSEDSKECYLWDLRSLMKWIFMNGLYFEKNMNYDQVFGDTTYVKNRDESEPVIVELHKIKEAANKCGLKMKFLILLGFDSGARPSELYNIRRKDINWNKSKKSYEVYIRYPKVKSYKRNIDVPYCEEIINEYFNKYTFEPDEPVIKIKYKFANGYLKKLFREIGIEGNGKKKVNLYTLRHCSIQHYIELYKGNHQHLAIRYGWSLATVPKRISGYTARSSFALPDSFDLVNQSKIKDIEISMKIKNDEMEQMRHQLNSVVDVLVKKGLKEVNKKYENK